MSHGKLYLKFRIGPLWWGGSELCLVSLVYMQYFHEKIFYMCLYYFVATSFLKMLLAMKNNWMRGVGEQPFQLRKYSRLIFFARNVKQFSIVFWYKLGFTIFKLHTPIFDTSSVGKILDWSLFKQLQSAPSAGIILQTSKREHLSQCFRLLVAEL